MLLSFAQKKKTISIVCNKYSISCRYKMGTKYTSIKQQIWHICIHKEFHGKTAYQCRQNRGYIIFKNYDGRDRATDCEWASGQIIRFKYLLQIPSVVSKYFVKVYIYSILISTNDPIFNLGLENNNAVSHLFFLIRTQLQKQR